MGEVYCDCCTGFCRVVHLLRVLDPDKLGTFPSRIDNIMVSSFQCVTGVALSSSMLCHGGFWNFGRAALGGCVDVTKVLEGLGMAYPKLRQF